MTTHAPTLAPRTTTRRHLMSLTAGPGRPVAAALATATAHARDAARSVARAALDASSAALESVLASVPRASTHAVALYVADAAMAATSSFLRSGTAAYQLAARRDDYDTITALAKRWAHLTGERIGWDIAALRPGRVFVMVAANAGHADEGRTWAALEATALAMGAALAVLDADATPDAMARAQRDGADAVALAGAVTGL